MKEILVGFAVGFVMQLFMAVIMLGGEFIDFNMGISMSKIYDPQVMFRWQLQHQLSMLCLF